MTYSNTRFFRTCITNVHRAAKCQMKIFVVYMCSTTYMYIYIRIVSKCNSSNSQQVFTLTANLVCIPKREITFQRKLTSTVKQSYKAIIDTLAYDGWIIAVGKARIDPSGLSSTQRSPATRHFAVPKEPQ